MADSLPSPPTTRGSSPSHPHEPSTKDELIHRLDDLLEKYLQVLDEYSVLREELSKTFSDGFLSIAHAQRTSNLGPGRWYGQDGYDGRMKALKRVVIECDGRKDLLGRSSTESSIESPNDEMTKLSNRYTAHVTHHDPRKIDEPEGEDDTTPRSTSKEANNLSSGKTRETTKSSILTKQDQAPKKPKIDPAYRDPVTWYGILVPPALRQAQRHFSKSMESTIPNLFSAASSLRSLEEEIWLARAELGAQGQYSDEDVSQLSVRSMAGSVTQA